MPVGRQDTCRVAVLGVVFVLFVNASVTSERTAALVAAFPNQDLDHPCSLGKGLLTYAQPIAAER